MTALLVLIGGLVAGMMSAGYAPVELAALLGPLSQGAAEPAALLLSGSLLIGLASAVRRFSA